MPLGGGQLTWGRYLLIGGSALFGIYYVSSLQEVPYSHRRHAIMFVSNSLERRIGQTMFASVRGSNISHTYYTYM